jgi:hypothetical protein
MTEAAAAWRELLDRALASEYERPVCLIVSTPSGTRTALAPVLSGDDPTYKEWGLKGTP